MATQLVGRNDILAVGIAHHQYLRGWQIQGTHAQGEDGRVRFADAHHGGFYHILEIPVNLRILQHLVDIAVEIGNEYHRITRLLQMLQYLLVLVQ